MFSMNNSKKKKKTVLRGVADRDLGRRSRRGGRSDALTAVVTWWWSWLLVVAAAWRRCCLSRSLEAGRTISHARTPRTIYGCEINSPVLSASFPGVSSRSGILGGSWLSSFSRLEHARVVLGLGHWWRARNEKEDRRRRWRRRFCGVWCLNSFVNAFMEF